MRTGYWIKKLDQKVTDAMYLAAITHDIERAFNEGRTPPSDELRGAKWDDPVYNEWHSERSVKFVSEFLKKNGADKKLVEGVSKLVRVHEEGGWKEADALKDADSISFLEINASYFISKIGKDLSKQEVIEKFEYMFNRIGGKNARKIVKPFYEKALEELGKVKVGD